jgi:hypothetical protein
VESAGANMGASVVASASSTASREVGFNLQGSARGPHHPSRHRDTAGGQWPNGCALSMPRKQRGIVPSLIDTAAIRNGCKLLKRKERCTV